MKLNINPSEGAVVGDTLYDVIPANKIGAFSILLQQCSSEINIQSIVYSQENISPMLKVSSLCELLEIIKNYT